MFNNLTGARQHVGNWPGVTVEKKEGNYNYQGYKIKVVDENITLLVAFGAGLASFLSPCVLPMVPIYLASLYGLEIFDSKGFRIAVFLHSLCFVLGFTVIFVFLGVIAGITGHAIIPDVNLLFRILPDRLLMSSNACRPNRIK